MVDKNFWASQPPWNDLFHNLSHSVQQHFKSLEDRMINLFYYLQVRRALNQKLACLGGEPGIFMAGKSSFWLQHHTRSFHRNKHCYASNAISGNKTYLDRRNPNSFQIYAQPLDAETAPLRAAEFSMFIRVLPLDQSWAEVIKTWVCCGVNWLGCKCRVNTFPLFICHTHSVKHI